MDPQDYLAASIARPYCPRCKAWGTHCPCRTRLLVRLLQLVVSR